MVSALLATSTTNEPILFYCKKIEKQRLRGYTLHPSSEHLTSGLRLNISKAKKTITS